MTRGKRSLLLAGVIAAFTARADAQVQFPKVTRNYSATLARAMDECIPSGLSVIGSGLPTTGCVATNLVTDDQMTFDAAKIEIRAKSGRIKVSGRGFPLGARVRLQLLVRVTKDGMLTKHPPSTNQRVTFSDQTLLCGPSPFGFVTSARGILAGTTDLSTCVAPNGGLASGNIEVLEAALVNVDNSDRVFARPGILR
jgi:hypothetical protein